MNFCAPKTVCLLAVLTAAAAAPWLAAAEQAIIFSKPADAAGAAQSDPNLTPTTPEKKHETRSLFSLPMSVFERSQSGPGVAPMGSGGPAPSVSPDQLKAWQKALDSKSHWTLMTPQEILGIPTPEKILGLPSKDGDDKLSPEERFTRRRDKAAGLLEIPVAPAKTPNRSDVPLSNNQSPFARKTFDNVFSPVNEKNSAGTTAASGVGTAARSGSFLGSMLGPFASAEKPETRWGNSFNFAAQPPKPTPQQLAGMERFRESMQPAASFQKPAEASRAARVAPRDPFMSTMPELSPRGGSYVPLKSEAARPIGLTPLPGITTRLPVTPARSAAQPDLPPWLRDDGGKPNGMPTRKF